MSNNSTKILFMTTLISGIMITISSNSWFGAWMGLEINLLSFIPLMSSQENIFTTEASLKYFLIQAMASTILLFSIISKVMIENMFSIITSFSSSILLITPLLLKSGAAPFHWWFPSVMEGLNWINCLILMTIQKISPLILISYSLKINLYSMTIILLSILIGALGGYNQTSIRKILTYSSINHMGWMLSSMLLGENFWLMYFMFYTLLTITIITIINPSQASFINQISLTNNNNPVLKFFLFSSLLSLGGLPPFLGFFPKWIIIQNMTINYSFWMMSIMVIASLITLYYYLRISYTSFLILHSEPSWNLLNYKNSTISNIILSIITNLGMIMITIMMIIF